jgi:hypothetical protein
VFFGVFAVHRRRGRGERRKSCQIPWFLSTHAPPVAVAHGGDALPLYHNHRRCPEFSSTVPEAIFVIFKCCCVCLDTVVFWFTCFFFLLFYKHVIMGEKVVKRDVCVCIFFIYVIEL